MTDSIEISNPKFIFFLKIPFVQANQLTGFYKSVTLALNELKEAIVVGSAGESCELSLLKDIIKVKRCLLLKIYNCLRKRKKTIIEDYFL